MPPLVIAILLPLLGQSGSGSCNAYPATIHPGDSATIVCSCAAVSQWNASAGALIGSGTTATFSSIGAPPGSVKISAVCSDPPETTQSVFLTIAAPLVPEPFNTQPLCPVQFVDDPDRQSRVLNDAKGCLDQVALDLKMQPDASLAIIGNSSMPGKKGLALAAKRALNTKDYLTKFLGIDQARVTVWTGNAKEDEATIFLVPLGADLRLEFNDIIPIGGPKVKWIPQ